MVLAQQKLPSIKAHYGNAVQGNNLVETDYYS